MPPVLKTAYDDLTDEQKASKENALQAAADKDARDENLHAVLGRVVERFMAKYPSEKDFPGFVKEELQGAFYVEILQVFKEQDFPKVSRDDLLPTQEDVLALTRLLDQHNDSVQRAELERLGAEHARKAREIIARKEAVSDAREEAIKQASIDSEAYQKQTDNRERSAMITNMAANANDSKEVSHKDSLAPKTESAEANALMQQFRQAVYARLTNPEMGRKMSPEEAIEHRSILFKNWSVTAQKNHRESDELTPDFVRHWVVADVTSFRKIPPERQDIAANDIFHNMSANSSYAETLRSIDARISARIKILNSANGQKESAKEERKRREHEAIKREQEANGFASGSSPDNETSTAKPADPEPLVSKVLESVTYKTQRDGSVLYMVSNRPAFVDHGQQILMAAKADDDEEAILAAVLLAKEKYGGAFELTGSEEFKRRAIEIMLKHEIDVKLKNPQQDALRRELAKMRADAANDQSKEKNQDKETLGKPVIGKPAEEAPAPVDATAAQTTTTSSSPATAPQETAPGPFAADLVPVRALDWWSVQRNAIHAWAKNDTELQSDLQQLGPEPSADQVYWFDKSGRQCDPPVDAATYLSQVKPELPGFVSSTNAELHVRDAISSTDSSAEVVSDINQKELTMAATAETESNKNQEPPLILRGVKKLDNGEFDTTVLLFKGKGDYLQGYVKIGDQKHQVLAHLNERKPNQETGEAKPNFIKLSEPHGQGDDTTWKEIGFGNAVNHRKDGKSVYHDEVLFSVGNEVLKARVTKHVDDELHRQLGFLEPRKPRSSDENKSAMTSGDALPKPTAPAAKAKEDAAGAPKARRSSRAKA